MVITAAGTIARQVVPLRECREMPTPPVTRVCPTWIRKAQWVVRGLSLFALGLGALSVRNVGIVTVRQRVPPGHNVHRSLKR